MHSAIRKSPSRFIVSQSARQRVHAPFPNRLRRPNSSLAHLLRVALSCAVLSFVGSAFTGCGGAAANGYNVAGVRLYQQGQYQAALQQFQMAQSTQPNNADSYYNLASTVHRLGVAQRDPKLLGQAETLYNQCLDMDANHADCYRALAVLLVETNRSDKAFTLVKNWVASNPRSAESRIELARLYEEFGDRDSATTFLQQALALEQNNPRAWAALGKLREEAGDVQQALANYQRSLNLNRNQPGLPERVATLQRQAGGLPFGVSPNGTRTVTNPTGPVVPQRRY